MRRQNITVEEVALLWIRLPLVRRWAIRMGRNIPWLMDRMSSTKTFWDVMSTEGGAYMQPVVSNNSTEACDRIDWWHGLRATCALVSADDRGWLGPSPPTDRHRIPSSREPAAQRPIARQAYPVHRRRASAAGEESQGSGTQGAAGTGDDRFSGYSAALAPTIDRRKVEFHAPAWAWAARNHAADLGSDCPHGP